ncbi:hypothetical protein C0J50_8290 [Silurus asotus]|uniref:Endonuclease/exonuclease/phosphatase domain-containing protein n=1 Tax=Silurus asotus TaxID=30991 RepID=A0AAD5B4Y1_SILAS|nr:hypothetical protein C0J50_8290 [Silurus asotus]
MKQGVQKTCEGEASSSSLGHLSNVLFLKQLLKGPNRKNVEEGDGISSDFSGDETHHSRVICELDDVVPSLHCYTVMSPVFSVVVLEMLFPFWTDRGLPVRKSRIRLQREELYETKWKGSKARNIGGVYKLLYHGVDGKRNGVGVILKEEYICCEMEEKERFWSELDEVVDGVPRKERLVIGTDFNGHVGEGNRGDEEVMGRYGIKERNVEGQMVVDFAERMEMAVVNTYFMKKENYRVTYKSGGRCTQVDYVLCRRCNLKEIGDCKVLAGDSVASQHRIVVCRMVLEANKKRRRVRTKRRIRWWKLKEEECSVRFREEDRQGLGGGEEVLGDWETTAELMREAARKVLGVTSGNRKEDKETWW